MKLQNDITNDDEIDLVALMFSLWKRKWTIVLTTIIFMIASIGYVLITPQVWTSTATVTVPEVKNLINYLSKVEKYNVITGVNSNYKKLDIDQVFTQFKNVLFSRSYQVTYLEKTEPYQEYLAKGKTPAQALNMLLKDIKIAKFDDKDNLLTMNAINVSFSAKTPELAQKLLNGLVENADILAQRNIIENQLAKIKILQSSLENEENRIGEITEIQKKIKLQELQQALQTAKNAGIKDYLSRNNNNNQNKNTTTTSTSLNNVSFMLGEKYLTAEINSLNKLSIIYPPRYYQIKTQLNTLKTLVTTGQNVQFSTYSYQNTPSYPVERTKPKRAIIVISGSVLGIIVGILIALFMNTIATYHRKENNLE